MIRHTSDKGFVNTISADPVRGLLYDFDIEGDALKYSHTQWLDTQVVNPIQKEPTKRWKIFLEGSTSRTGAEQYDLDLSQRRAEAVQQYLRGKLAGLPADFDTEWVGRAKAVAAGNSHSDEDRLDRAVQVALDETKDPPPPPLPNNQVVYPRPIPRLPDDYLDTEDERDREFTRRILQRIPPDKRSRKSILDAIKDKVTDTLNPVIKKLPRSVQDKVRDAIVSGLEKGLQAPLDQALSQTQLSDTEKEAIRNAFQGLLKEKVQ
jgi:hypothetical protein